VFSLATISQESFLCKGTIEVANWNRSFDVFQQFNEIVLQNKITCRCQAFATNISSSHTILQHYCFFTNKYPCLNIKLEEKWKV